MDVCPLEQRTRFQQISRGNWTLIQMEMQKGNLAGAQQGEEHQPSNDWTFKVGFWKQDLSSFGGICCLFWGFFSCSGMSLWAQSLIQSPR